MAASGSWGGDEKEMQWSDGAASGGVARMQKGGNVGARALSIADSDPTRVLRWTDSAKQILLPNPGSSLH